MTSMLHILVLRSILCVIVAMHSFTTLCILQHRMAVISCQSLCTPYRLLVGDWHHIAEYVDMHMLCYVQL